MKQPKFRLLPSFLAIALFVGVTQWMMTQTLQAQEGPDVSTESAEAAPQEGQGKSLIDMFKAGGLTMYPLTLLSVAGFGLIVYNFMAVKSGPILAPKVTPEIEKALGNLDLARAKSICEENPSPTTNIVHAGLARVDLKN